MQLDESSQTQWPIDLQSSGGDRTKISKEQPEPFPAEFKEGNDSYVKES